MVPLAEGRAILIHTGISFLNKFEDTLTKNNKMQGV